MKTGITTLDSVLQRLGEARDRDEHHRLLCELAPLASRYIEELSARFNDEGFPRFGVTWALIGNCDDRAIALLVRAIKDPDKFVRWAACEALSRCNGEIVEQALVAALKDRSALAKGVAVLAMQRLKPRSAVDQLTRIAQSKHLQTHSPGIVKDARTALKRIERSS